MGPGTTAVSMGFGKYFPVTERMKVRFESTFTNLPNHPNFDRPSNLNITSSSFGKLTSVLGADNAGNRTAQFALRFLF